MNSLQRYASIVAGNARQGTNLGYGGAEKTLGNVATGSAVALTSLYPVVKNNLQYADSFNTAGKATANLGKGVNAYANYKSALGLTEPGSGGNNLANMLSPGNLAGSGASYAMMSNPITASLAGVNMLTADEENPYGTIPGVKQLNKGISTVANKLNQTPVARAIREPIKGLYDNTLGRLFNTEPGRFASSVFQLPFNAVEGTVGAVREGYQALDRGLFGGLLPGGAKDGVAETQRYDNPFTGLQDNINNVKSTFTDMVTKDEPIPETLSQADFIPSSDFPFSPAQAEARDEYNANQGSVNKVQEGLDSLLDIAEEKGMADQTRSIFPSSAKFSTGSYSRSGGDLAMVDTGSGPRPIVQTQEFRDWLDGKAKELGPQGFMSWYKEISGGQDRGGLYNHPTVFEKFIGIDPKNPLSSLDQQGGTTVEWRSQGIKFEPVVNVFKDDVAKSQSAVTQTIINNTGVGPNFTGIDLNPVEGVNRVIGEQGARLGPDTGIGSYRILI